MIDNSIIENNVLSILNNIFEISRNSAKSSKMCNDEKFSDVDFIGAFDYLLKNLIWEQRKSKPTFTKKGKNTTLPPPPPIKNIAPPHFIS
mgnify:CR=1 FL=1